LPQPRRTDGLDLELCARAAESCACFNLRKASRAVTQAFDEALQPTGLRSTQLVVLLAAALFEQASVSHLARELVLDRTTLTRNLRPLTASGLVRLSAGRDAREKQVELTAKGRRTLARALPVWAAAQRKFVDHVGTERWDQLHVELARITTLGLGT
jgi:DNA-binding MarR family transcriptional regulator